MSNDLKTNFGCMTMNLAAAIGVKQATQTVNTATKTLDQQCALQEQMAKEIGGVGKDAGEGLIDLQFTEQMNSATKAGSAIQDEAFGSLASAIVGTVGFAGSSIASFKSWKDDDLEKQLEKANKFSQDLGTQPTHSQPGQAHMALQNDPTIDSWMGSATKEADFSAYDTVNDQNSMNTLKNDHTKFRIVRHNIDKHISNLQEKISSYRTQKQNTFVNFVGQGAQAGEGFAGSGGKLSQASNQVQSQQDSAEASLDQTALDATKAQEQSAQQAASTYQNEIASILQGIAFPA